MSLFGLLLTGAVVEVVAGLAVADQIGAGWTVLLLLLTSAAGAVLLRGVTARAVQRVRRAAEAGRPPTREIVDAANGFAGALLIAAPGFVSAALGLLLLAPPLRPVARRVEGALLRRRAVTVGAGGWPGWSSRAGPGYDEYGRSGWDADRAGAGAPQGLGDHPGAGSSHPGAGRVVEGSVVEEHVIEEHDINDPPDRS